MEGAFGAVAFIVALVLGIGLWTLSMSMDKDRITAYIRERGGRIVSISWAPFGKGWFGEKNDRIYEVVYYDKAGNQHFASCKTGFWSGVYWTEDRITHRKSKWYDAASPSNEPGQPLIRQIPELSDEDDELSRLREENARLREQLEGRASATATNQSSTCPACGTKITPQTVRCPSCQIALQ